MGMFGLVFYLTVSPIEAFGELIKFFIQSEGEDVIPERADSFYNKHVTNLLNHFMVL